MYKQITPASDWFFVSKYKDKTTNMPIVFRIVAWATTNDKLSVPIGLIGEFITGGSDDAAISKIPRLVSVPPIQGSYKHLSSLTEEEKIANSYSVWSTTPA